MVEPVNKRCTDEEVIAAYKLTGSIWKAGKRLGLAGQTVHERLRRLDYTMAHQEWTDEELNQAVSLAKDGEPIGKIAESLGRTYYAVAIKLTRNGVKSHRPDWRSKKPRHGSGLTKQRVAVFAKKLEDGRLTVRRLARMEGYAITPLVDALQYHEPDKWQRYVANHSDLDMKKCIGCKREFVPLTKKQEFCTVRCRESHRRNMEYFGGRRQETIGLQEGICQLCRKHVDKWLASHHVLGKENDPDNELLIALCRGCHDAVTRLAAKPWIENAGIVADFVSLCLARRGKINTHVLVETEQWSDEEIAENYGSVPGVGIEVDEVMPS